MNLAALIHAPAETTNSDAADPLRRAANAGDAEAQFILGARRLRDSSHKHGEDQAEIRMDALMWFVLSAAGRCNKTNAWAKRLRLDLSRSDVMEAIRRAETFGGKPPGAAAGCLA